MRIFASLLVFAVYLISFGGCAKNKNWNTLYSFTDGKVYVHLNNNDLVSLNFSITGYDSSDDMSYLGLTDGQTVTSLSPPPENATLVLMDGDLYGFVNNSTSSSKDTCGCGIISLVKYNNNSDSWSSVPDLNFDNLDDASFLQQSSYLTSPINKETLYIYGGLCEENNEASDRLLSFDLSTLKFSNISTSTKPSSFYGASNVLGPDSSTQILIGGQSDNAWLNMYQLATWDFSSGWSFQQVKKDDDITINSRRSALALPVFNSLANNTKETISSDLEVSEVILIGGDLLEDLASPTFARLSIKNSNWEWENITTSMKYDEILGAVTLFETLVVINSTDVSKRDSNTEYKVNLYFIDNFESVDSIESNTPADASGTSDNSSATTIKNKAIIGSVFSVVGVAFGIVGGLYYLKRRKRKREINDLNNMDYQIGNFYDQESTISARSKNLMNDTNSTLEVASFESWFKKRQRFDEERMKTVRNSYLPSNETLSSDTSISEPAPLTPATIHKSTFKTQISPIQNALVNRSVSRIKESFSFNNSVPSSPINGTNESNSIKPKRSIISLSNKRLPTQTDSLFARERKSLDMNRLQELESSDGDVASSSEESSVDDEVDVQVLVSSKRRSVLRIANPDLDQSLSSTKEDLTILLKDNLPEELEYINTSDSMEDVSHDPEKPLISRNDSKASLRQRIPSGERTIDF